MGIQIVGGLSGSVAEVGAASGLPLHVNIKPVPYGSLGHYVAQGLSGTVAAGAGALSEIFQLRYTGSNLCIVQSVMLEHFSSLGTGFAAGVFRFVLTRATAWTGDGTGGGTVTPLKMRTSMGNAVATLRIPTTAALGAGTKNLDATDLRERRGIVGTAVNTIYLGYLPGATTTVANGIGVPQQLLPDDGVSPQAHPVVLANNEGLVIRATVPGTGTWEVQASFRFAEATAY